MTNLEALAIVVELALTIEDRDRRENRALVKVAHQVDKSRNRQTTSNKDALIYYAEPSRLAVEAGCSDSRCRVCTREPCRCTLSETCENCKPASDYSETIPAGERCAS